MSHILLGRAELGIGGLASAKRSFDEVRKLQSRGRILMVWIWKLPLQLGLAELHLAAGDVKAARTESEIFVSLAHDTAECNWIGLAHYTQARVALAEQDSAMGDIEIQKGLSAIHGREAPLAAWRIHALAAATGGFVDNRIQAQAVVRQLAESLPESDPLRLTFLAARPQVIAVGHGLPSTDRKVRDE
ncbi:MAG: hypothetical protein JO270_14775 [Acidobacteriaceae bacterium]|nr:hypothetical protein [Acidobacteriaceae bacterium]